MFLGCSKLINVAVPGTIDERAINTKRVLNPWERNENHTLCLNSAKAVGCTVVNIGTQDFIEGRRHLVLGVISQIIKIQLLADLNLKKTPQLVELVDDSKDVEELMSLPPEKILLRMQRLYAHLLNVLAPEHSKPSALAAKNTLEREQRMGSQPKSRYRSLKTSPDDAIISREERAFRFWINSLGHSTYINNVFEDLRNGWALLESLDKISPGIVNWKIANKPPIKMPFRKVENCNQVVKIGKQLKFSLVNIAGNDIVQGNKKLILAYLWQLMRQQTGSQSCMKSFKDKSLSDGIFFLELLSSVQPRVVNWSLVTKGVTDEEKKMNASYIISIARKLGCSIFLLPEDITEVNQKMILTLTASIMYWFLKQPVEDRPSAISDSESSSQLETISNSTLDDSASESSMEENGNL
ncbi:hypothetical protein M0R45_010157 [Rubus argutus]|uniref:Calponin-homology (CH) domain-containing protein n=1 Tax=Rubus argutus TaxID=59490 RepID=A0AAW1Y660_RUBAR